MIENFPKTETEAQNIVKLSYQRKLRKKNRHSDYDKISILGLGSEKAFIDYGLSNEIIYTPKLNKLLHHDPDETIITADAGLTLSKLNKVIAKHNQYLAFEPPNYNEILNGITKDQTLGGIIATNLSGSRRMSCGSLRDYLLGIKVVNGKGEILNFGSKVLKNVTGYDVTKLFAGSMGKLGLILAANLRLLPKPPSSLSVLIFETNLKEVSLIFRQLLTKPLEISSAAWICNKFAKNHYLESGIVIRLEGSKKSIDYRLGKICEYLRNKSKKFNLIRDTKSVELWQHINNLTISVPNNTNFTKTSSKSIKNNKAPNGYKNIWSVSLPASEFPKYLSKLKLDYDVIIDCGGAKIFLFTNTDINKQAEVRINLAGISGAFAKLIKASPLDYQSLARYQTLDKNRTMLEAKLISSFDPLGIFNHAS